MPEEYILEVRALKKYFPVGKPGLFALTETFVHAVDAVDLQLKRGEVIALVGESGCGKSTLPLTLMGRPIGAWPSGSGPSWRSSVDASSYGR